MSKQTLTIVAVLAAAAAVYVLFIRPKSDAGPNVTNITYEQDVDASEAFWGALGAGIGGAIEGVTTTVGNWFTKPAKVTTGRT